MVSGPNRPTNIKNMITRLPASDNSPVKPRDNPTVPKADIASKIISINAAFSFVDKKAHSFIGDINVSASAYPPISLDYALPNIDGEDVLHIGKAEQ